MRVLVAPDSFKGTFCAGDVAAAIARGVEGAEATADRCPVADGGEGTLDVLVRAHRGSIRAERALDPLGREIDATFGVFDGTAVVEVAAASGLTLLSPGERDPWRASTYGTGQLICAAAQTGVRRVLVTVGGSATVDGGRGALRAISDAGGLHGVQLVVLCDVRTPWERCAAIYGPQKGADGKLARRLEDRLEALAAQLPRDPRGIPGSGAAGGLAGALWAIHGAALEPGARYVLDAVDFDVRLQRTVAVICGEGRIDGQSTEGKIVAEVTARARAAGIRAHAVVGRNELDAVSARTLGLQSVTEATTLAGLEAAGARLGAVLLDQASHR